MKQILKLVFNENLDGSGDGILIMYIDGVIFSNTFITYTGQKEIMYRVVGEYEKRVK